MRDAIKRIVAEMLSEPAIKSIVEEELVQLRSCENCAGCKKSRIAVPGLSRLMVDKECRIFLADYNYVEVVIKGCQAKSLYLLYLLMESGIANKDMKSHESTLISIYSEVCKEFACDDYRAKEVIRGLLNRPGGISDATNKIRKALYSAIPSDSLRQYYMINGLRNQAREVRLPKELITVENEPLLNFFNHYNTNNLN